jgi:hypothetical protein
MGAAKVGPSEASLDRLAAQSQEFLEAIRGWGRPLALRTRLPSPQTGTATEDTFGLDPQFLEAYGLQNKLYWGVFTDEESLAVIRRDRRLLPFAIRRVTEKLTAAARNVEPTDLESTRAFLESLAEAILPRTHGRFSDLDPDEVRALFDERLSLNRKAQDRYRASGEFPPPHVLPVFLTTPDTDGEAGERVTIDDPEWPTEATWIFLEHFLSTPRATLERLVKQARAAKKKPGARPRRRARRRPRNH